MTPHRARCLLVAVLLAGPSLARGDDIVAEISAKGLDFVADELPALLPTSFSHSGFTKQLINCPSFTGGDTDLKVSNVKTKLTVSKVEITPSAASLAVTLSAAGSGSLDAAVSRPYACVGSTLNCKVTFSVSKATATLSTKPQITAGKPKLSNTQVSIGVSSDDVDISLSSCGFAAKLGNLVMPLVKGFVVDKVKDYIEDLAAKELPPQLEKSLASFTQLDGELAGIGVAAQLDSLSTASTGIQAGVALDLQAKTQPACTLSPAPTISAPGAPPDISFTDEHLAVLLPQPTPARALVAAWEAGLLCLSGADLEQLGMPSTAGTLIGALIGLGTVDELSIAAPEAPSLDYVAGTDPRVVVTLSKVNIVLDGKNGLAQPTTVTIAMTVEVDAQLTLDPISRGVMLDVKSVTISGLQLSATEPKGLNLSAKLVQTLIESAVVPLITAQLVDLRLVPTVLHKTGGTFDPYYLTLSRSDTTTSDLTLWAKAFRKPSSDSSAPATSLDVQPSPLVAPQLFRFVASGTDDKTPSDLLRFGWRLDNGDWSDAGFARDLSLQLKSGTHTVEVRAVDLNGNIDTTGASATFTVDGVAPTLTLSESPPDTIQAATASVSWTMSDDFSPVNELWAKAVAVHKDPDTGQETSFYDGIFVAGVTSLDLQDLTNGDYTVTVVARDQAGNLSKPVVVSFTVEGQQAGLPGAQPGLEGNHAGEIRGGCAMAAAAAPGGGLAWLLLIGLLVPTLRRRR